MKTPAILLCINLVAALQFYEKADSGDKACGLLHQAVAISGLSGRYLNVDRYCEALNQPYLGSMAACLVDSFDDEKYVEHFVSTCLGQISRDDFDRAYQNASRYLVNGTSSEGLKKHKQIRYRLILNQCSTRQTTHTATTEQTTSHSFSASCSRRTGLLCV